MYIVTVYDDLDKEVRKIIGFIYFCKMKHIIKFSNNLIRYNDLKQNQNKKYKTYKDLFSIEEVNSINVCKYFSDHFYDNF